MLKSKIIMTEFVDYVKIYVSSEREEKDLHICIEKKLLKGGPDGGDGGRGDMFICRKQRSSYFTLNSRHIKAGNGGVSGDRSTGC
jgi:GTP-binding protein